MQAKGNRVENWSASYEHLQTSFDTRPTNAGNLVNLLGFEHVHDNLREYLSDVVNPRILETGCGGARASLYLAQRGYDVTCSDLTPEALRLASDNFAANNARGKFLLDDLLNSKLPAESFDCVMSFGLLEHFEDLAPLTAALTRLVKPNGIQIHDIIPLKFSTRVIVDALLFPLRFARNLWHRQFDQIISRSFRDFPHYENSFSAAQYCEAFTRGGNQVLRCEAAGIVFPLINWPMGLSDPLVRRFHVQLTALIKALERTESPLLHRLGSSIYLVCRKSAGA